MDNEIKKGLYEKYQVIKANGEPVDHNNFLFVLLPETDPAALEALWTYATETDNRQLGKDLLLLLSNIEKREVY